MGKKRTEDHGTRAMYGYGCRCDDCKAANAAYKAAWRAKNPEKVSAYFRDWHLKNKDRRNTERLERYRANRDEELAKARLYLYGITEAEFVALVAAQAGVCAICKKAPRPGKALHVDHDHACCPGKRSCGLCIRGLLCNSCNLTVGKMQDSPALLRAAADYLERKPQRLTAA